MVETNNVLVTPKVFAKLALINLRSKNNVCRNMSTDVTSEFANKAMKIGDTVTVRRPYRFLVTKGLGWQPQPLQDTTMPIKVDQPLGIHFQWDTIEKTLSLREANELYAQPAAIAMASEVNKLAAQFCAQNTPNYVGTPGTIPSAISTFLEAGDRLIEVGVPENEELHLIMNRAISSAYVNARANYFNPTVEISQMLTKGRITDHTLGYTIDRDQSLYTHTTGTYVGTPVIDATSTMSADGGDNATQTIVISGFNSSSSNVKVGDKFTIADVYAVHPQTRQSTGRLKQFTILADASDSSGAITATIFPAITPTGQYQNVSAAAVTGKAVMLWAGSSGTPVASSEKTGPQALVMHKNAFAFVSVPLANPKPSVVEVVAEDKDPETGMWLSFIRAFDSVNRIWVNRFDTLVGYGKLYAAEMSCVIAG